MLCFVSKHVTKLQNLSLPYDQSGCGWYTDGTRWTWHITITTITQIWPNLVQLLPTQPLPSRPPHFQFIVLEEKYLFSTGKFFPWIRDYFEVWILTTDLPLHLHLQGVQSTKAITFMRVLLSLLVEIQNTLLWLCF